MAVTSRAVSPQFVHTPSGDYPRFGRKRVAGPRDTLVLIGPGSEDRRPPADRWPAVGDFLHAQPAVAQPPHYQPRPPTHPWQTQAPAPMPWGQPIPPAPPIGHPYTSSAPPVQWEQPGYPVPQPSYEPSYGLPPQGEQFWSAPQQYPGIVDPSHCAPYPCYPQYVAPRGTGSPTHFDRPFAMRRPSLPSPFRSASPSCPPYPPYPAYGLAYNPAMPEVHSSSAPWPPPQTTKLPPYGPPNPPCPPPTGVQPSMLPGLPELVVNLLQSLVMPQPQHSGTAPPSALSSEQCLNLLQTIFKAQPSPTNNTTAPPQPVPPSPRKVRHPNSDDEGSTVHIPTPVRPAVSYDTASEDSYDWKARYNPASRRSGPGQGPTPRNGVGPFGGGNSGSTGPPPRWVRPNARRPEPAERTIFGGGFVHNSPSPQQPHGSNKLHNSSPKRLAFEQVFPPKKKQGLLREVPNAGSGDDDSHLPPSEGQSFTAAAIAQRFNARRQQLQEWQEKADAEWNRLRNQRLATDSAERKSDKRGTSNTNEPQSSTATPNSPHQLTELPPPSQPDPEPDEFPSFRKPKRRTTTPNTRMAPNPNFFSAEEPNDSRRIVIRNFDVVAHPYRHRKRNDSPQSTDTPTPQPVTFDDGMDGPLRVTMRVSNSNAPPSTLSPKAKTSPAVSPVPSRGGDSKLHTEIDMVEDEKSNVMGQPYALKGSPKEQGARGGKQQIDSDGNDRDDVRNVDEDLPPTVTPELSPLGRPPPWGSTSRNGSGSVAGSDSGDSPRKFFVGGTGPRPRTRSPSPVQSRSASVDYSTHRHINAILEVGQQPRRHPSVQGNTPAAGAPTKPRFVHIRDLEFTSVVLDEEPTDADATLNDAASDILDDDHPAETSPTTMVVSHPPQPVAVVKSSKSEQDHCKTTVGPSVYETEDEDWSNPVSDLSVPHRTGFVQGGRAQPSLQKPETIMESKAVLHRCKRRHGPGDTCSSLSVSEVSDSEPPTLSISVHATPPPKPVLSWPSELDDDSDTSQVSTGTPVSFRQVALSPHFQTSSVRGDVRPITPITPVFTAMSPLSQYLMDKARVQANLEHTQTLLDCLDAL